MDMENRSLSRIGEQRKSKLGETMTIIAYRSSKDIDIQFADGSIAYKKTYGNFLSGRIGNPANRKGNDRKKGKVHEGETVEANNGHLMQLTEYRSYEDCDVTFDNGVTVTHVSYRNFRRGYVSMRKSPEKKWLAKGHQDEKGTSRDGRPIRILNYHGSENVDVIFEDTGEIIKARTYSQFKRGFV